MAKIKISLESDPAPTFKQKVSLPTPEGPADVMFEFIYRDRVQMAELLDGWRAAAAKAAEAEAGDPAAASDDGATRARAAIKADIETLLQIASGWDLPWAFGAEKIGLFVTRYPGAMLEVIGQYQAACTRGRLGN